MLKKQLSRILEEGDTEFTSIYSLSDPISGEIRYVGKSDNPNLRLIEHIKKSKYTITHKNNWIKSLLKKNLKPVIEILDTVPISEWGFWENYWIEMIRAWEFKLTNIANGGCGGNLGPIVNRKISIETINKMKISASKRKCIEEIKHKMSLSQMGINNPMYGKIRTESSKKYRSVTQYDKNLNFIKRWIGITIASKSLNINRCTITDVCNYRKKTAGGYIWKYSN